MYISVEQLIKFSASSKIEVFVLGDCLKFHKTFEHNFMFACLCLTMPNVPASGTICESFASIHFMMRVKAKKFFFELSYFDTYL